MEKLKKDELPENKWKRIKTKNNTMESKQMDKNRKKKSNERNCQCDKDKEVGEVFLFLKWIVLKLSNHYSIL